MKDKKNIVIVGCGQIGSRHLQGVIKLGLDLKLQIVEPSEQAQKTAADRAAQAKTEGQEISIEWLKDASKLDRRSDLAIVATSSKEREQAITQLLEMGGHKRFLVEKMVCQSKDEYERLLERFRKYEAGGWVNTIRRYNESYQSYAPLFSNGRIVMNIAAGNLGLGSNAIHYLDLFAMFQGNNEIKLNGGHLDKALSPNKRGAGFVEFTGTITGENPAGSFLSISFLPFNSPVASVYIRGEKNMALIDEVKGNTLLCSTDKQGKWEEGKYAEPMVSVITTQVARDIFEKNSCLLPSIEDSYSQHMELFRVFNEQIKLITGKLPEKCPVT